MSENELTPEELINRAVSGCQSIHDVVNFLETFIDPEIVDEEEQDHLMKLGAQRVAELQGTSVEEAEKELREELFKQ